MTTKGRGDHRWKLTTGRRHMSAEERAEAIQLYMDGATLRHIGAEYDRHPVLLGRLMARAGVQRGAKWRTKGSRQYLVRRLMEPVWLRPDGMVSP